MGHLRPDHIHEAGALWRSGAAVVPTRAAGGQDRARLGSGSRGLGNCSRVIVIIIACYSYHQVYSGLPISATLPTLATDSIRLHWNIALQWLFRILSWKASKLLQRIQAKRQAQVTGPKLHCWNLDPTNPTPCHSKSPQQVTTASHHYVTMCVFGIFDSPRLPKIVNRKLLQGRSWLRRWVWPGTLMQFDAVQCSLLR